MSLPERMQDAHAQTVAMRKERQAALDVQEQVIETAWAKAASAFLDVGRALTEIRDRQLYGAATFEDYCDERWDLSRSRAYQLIDAYAVSTMVDKALPAPQNERQLRALAQLKEHPEKVNEAWALAVKWAGDGRPSGKLVRQAMEHKARTILYLERQERGAAPETTSKPETTPKPQAAVLTVAEPDERARELEAYGERAAAALAAFDLPGDLLDHWLPDPWADVDEDRWNAIVDGEVEAPEYEMGREMVAKLDPEQRDHLAAKTLEYVLTPDNMDLSTILVATALAHAKRGGRGRRHAHGQARPHRADGQLRVPGGRRRDRRHHRGHRAQPAVGHRGCRAEARLRGGGVTKALTVHNASINTATVAIHTLTISGRQVTLATFRQLREESLIDYDGNFLGLPWGTVNYHPGNACPIGAHEHVVWQQGDELRRGTVEPPRFGLYRPAVDLTEWVIAHGKPSDKPVYGDDAKVWWEPAEFLRNGQFRLAQFPDIDISAPPPTEIGWRYRSFAIPREVWERQPSPAVAESLAQLNSELDDETERRQRHRDRWAEVQALPQLFIAT